MIFSPWFGPALVVHSLIFAVYAAREENQVGLAGLIDSSAPASGEMPAPFASPVTGVPMQHFVAQGQPASSPSINIDSIDHRFPLYPQPPTDPSPSRPPGLQVVFPLNNEAPVLDEHIIGILSANALRGTIHSIPASILNDKGVRERLVSYSEELMKQLNLLFHYHFAAHIDEKREAKTYLYMYRAISPDSFAEIFPLARYDRFRVTPIVAYRARAPQRYFLGYGKVEIAGVAMVEREIGRGTALIPLMPLSHIVAQLAIRPPDV